MIQMILQACNTEDNSLLKLRLVHGDGNGGRHLSAPAQTSDLSGSNSSVLEFASRKSSYLYIHMNGHEAFRFATPCVPQSIESTLKKAGLTASIRYFFQIPRDSMTSISKYSNLSTTSIPSALDNAVRSGKVKPRHTIVTPSFGAGLT
ncbi:hypothetical protein ES288_D03G199400v1 [Gossypium darwinii]|uniref:Beta-ketoacyl-[acyl-carrier-protein] synthase III C-terminal domain-containing protein n=1 Tax=Gossypium darwinii TaxID=34276 RepID=A0A5D2D9Y0_GOSDA|nr:hypothetical protein ES288_D03G199400v1 [Gossypium darwinii]